MTSWLVLISVLSLAVIGVVAGVPAECQRFTSCGECMSNFDCAWCLDNTTSASITSQRCISMQEREETCQNFEYSQSSFEILSQLAVGSQLNDEEHTLISPQKATVYLRPGDKLPQTIPIKAAQLKEYPIDVYVLMDLSLSMNESRKTFALEAVNVIKEFQKITSNLLLGFGSFVDKDLSPFSSTQDTMVCPDQQDKCMRPYGFHNQISLKNLTADEFKNKLLNANLAGNIDEPEGSLDALMQVLTCTQEIKWRYRSRKMVVLVTDRDFHFAADGRLLGILERNDGQCHLDEQGFYSESKNQDYPSLSQVGEKVYDGEFNLIAAVIPKYTHIWQALEQVVPNMYVVALEKDAANIVDIVATYTERVSRKIQLLVSDDFHDLGLSIEIYSECLGSELRPVRECDDIPLDTVVDFEVRFRASKCLPEPKTITLSMSGFLQTLEIKVQTQCSCPCQNESPPEANEQCNNHGKFECGGCQCESEYIGNTCQCKKDVDNDDESRKECVDPLGPKDLICNGRGTCKCGVCVDCYQSYDSFCQCRDDDCQKTESGLCDGHGQCQCGTCSCNAGWSGDDCSCSQSTYGCVSPYNQEICSGQGRCRCNRCDCIQQDTGAYTGSFCQLAPDETFPCEVLTNCVECLAFQTGDRAANDCDSCGHISLQNQTETYTEQTVCTGLDWENCEFKFSYENGGEMSPVAAFLLLYPNGERRMCPLRVDLAIAGGVFVAGLVLLGLAFICCYKCYLVFDDRRQYAKFSKEAEQLRYAGNQNANDVYRSPITIYKNPMHGREIPSMRT
ncbi:integrin beta-PS-like [Tigriopus californicus]|uniref:integrin beta-PS-like n=1 Tax=Tigriopus californicus TaxID=6832 RepID=UPI0027DA6261|nr:integrin beta-PS-like [Tigriopus californicus]|eukprot:TCALIF_00710-PA protein Name:"Similar to ITGB7 Integrin beta-7 (Homo sapiens)" AED:0.29 eAED:0.29 QI:0/-1/0/1/-1/1/1/0/789